MVLADDKVDNFIAVAVNVQVVDGAVAAAVAVDVAGVAVGDDAAGVGLADVEAGVGAVEELVKRKGQLYCSSSPTQMFHLRRCARWCRGRTLCWRRGLGLQRWQRRRLFNICQLLSFQAYKQVSLPLSMMLVDRALSSMNGLPAPPQTESDETWAP